MHLVGGGLRGRPENWNCLEIQLQTKLNIPGRSRGGYCAEATGSDHGCRCPVVRSVKGIEHVCLESQVKPFGDPELLAQ